MQQTPAAALDEGLFDEVVSLGWRCRAAKRLRTYFGTAKAYPFDWWVTPIEGAIQFLKDWDVEALYRTSRLHRALGLPSFIRHRDYGISLAHEFEPIGWGRGERGFYVTRPGWRRLTAEPKSRTTYLMRQFEALDRPGLRVLFVRHLSPDDDRSAATLEALRQAVLARAGACRARFLLISADGVEADGWTSLTLPDRSIHWPGDDALWAAALDGLGFRLKRPLDEAGARSHRKAQKLAKQRRQAREA